MSSNSNPEPTPKSFKDPCDHLGSGVIPALTLRCRRIAAESKLAETRGELALLPDYMYGPNEDPSTADEDDLQAQAEELRRQEQAAFATLAAQEEAHRAAGREPLPVDVVCEEYKLSADERLVLMALVLPCLGHELAQRVFDPLDRVYYRGLTVDALATLILSDTTDLAERVAKRKLFSRKAHLLTSGLVLIDYGHGTTHAEDVWDARVYLSWDGIGRLLGDKSLIDPPESHEEPTAPGQPGGVRR